ncbi:MAG: hypothetical protein K2H46_07560 [Muribaculaceae bacterium]|nr:hypothetical protein [Muribaculaceae bacterium]
MADKTKNAQNKCFEKLFHCFIVILLIMPLVAGIASCGSDDKENEPTVNPTAALYGAWTAEHSVGENGNRVDHEVTIIFNDQGLLTGSGKDCIWGVGNGALLTYTLPEYHYKVMGNTINLYMKDAINNQPSTILSYSIKDDRLHLKYITGEKPGFISLLADAPLYNNIIVFTRN